MKTKIILAITAILMNTAALADEVKIGILLGFTGPIESFSPGMRNSARLAWKEISDTGLFLGGKKIVSLEADTTCSDSAAAVSAAERLINSEKVVAILGAGCSGVTASIANNVAVPNGILMISPSATTPSLSTLDDNGYFFRTASSDSRQGEVLADITIDRGIKSVAVTYTNNDYGKGLADTFSQAFKKRGGIITIMASHEDGKADYSAEIAALAASGADDLAVFGYLDQGGKGIIRSSLDSGAYSRFILGDGMIGESLINVIGSELTGSFGTAAGSVDKKFENILKKSGFSVGSYAAESYDAAALIALAMQAAGSTNRKDIQSKVMDVANAPGEKIYVGELEKALRIIAQGGDIDYEGVSRVEFDEVGDVSGIYKEVEVKDNKFQTVKIH